MVKLGSVIHETESLERPKGIKKDRTVLEKLGLMVWLDGIRLDNLT